MKTRQKLQPVIENFFRWFMGMAPLPPMFDHWADKPESKALIATLDPLTGAEPDKNVVRDYVKERYENADNQIYFDASECKTHFIDGFKTAARSNVTQADWDLLWEWNYNLMKTLMELVRLKNIKDQQIDDKEAMKDYVQSKQAAWDEARKMINDFKETWNKVNEILK